VACGVGAILLAQRVKRVAARVTRQRHEADLLYMIGGKVEAVGRGYLSAVAGAKEIVSGNSKVEVPKARCLACLTRPF
jgi:hypothetical protein